MKAIPSIHSAAGLRVRFIEGDRGDLIALELDLPREQAVLGDVHAELRELGVEVTNVEIRAGAARVTERIQLSEQNGIPVSRERHLEIQDRVFRVFQARLNRARAKEEALQVAAG
jgi:hypothetical protein